MTNPIWTNDDLENARRVYEPCDLRWVLASDGESRVAYLRLDENERGPLDVKGPGFATYRLSSDGLDFTVTFAPSEG